MDELGNPSLGDLQTGIRTLITATWRSPRAPLAAAAQQAPVFTGTEKLLQTLADANIASDATSCTVTLEAVQRHHSAQTAAFVMNG